MKLAVMQPCYLPWRGYFALMKLADAFIHLDDVPLPQGRSYQTRVAIKTANGRHWLTVPVTHESNQLIRDVQIVDDGWRQKHLRTLQQELPAAAPVVADLYARSWTKMADFNIAATRRLAESLSIQLPGATFRSSDCRVEGTGWQKILNLCKATGATQYITGHGASQYFDHEAFDDAGIEVLYLDYDLSPYPQPHGTFDPYVTVLDLLAHAPDPSAAVHAELVPWRTFISTHPSNHQHAVSAAA